MQDRAARNLPKSYVALWAALGVVAAGYLLVIGTHPNQISQLLGTPRGTETAEADPAGDGTASARIESLLRQIAGLEQDRTALRQELARRTDHEANLTQRLAALETREPSDATPATGIRLLATIPAESPAPAATGKSGARAIDGKAAEAAAAKEALRKTAAKPTAAVAKPAAGGLSEVERLAERSQAGLTGQTAGALAIETGSLAAANTVKRPPVAFGAPTVVRTPAAAPASAPAGRGNAAIHLGTGPSVDALRMTWGLVHERGKSAVGALEPRYMASPGAPTGGEAYDLVAGPVASQEEALRICAQLKAQKISCGVATYGGNAL